MINTYNMNGLSFDKTFSLEQRAKFGLQVGIHREIAGKTSPISARRQRDTSATSAR
jgi:hypothetical protein